MTMGEFLCRQRKFKEFMNNVPSSKVFMIRLGRHMIPYHKIKESTVKDVVYKYNLARNLAPNERIEIDYLER